MGDVEDTQRSSEFLMSQLGQLVSIAGAPAMRSGAPFGEADDAGFDAALVSPQQRTAKGPALIIRMGGKTHQSQRQIDSPRAPAAALRPKNTGTAGYRLQSESWLAGASIIFSSLGRSRQHHANPRAGSFQLLAENFCDGADWARAPPAPACAQACCSPCARRARTSGNHGPVGASGCRGTPWP
jgi:hypothetical protein